MPPGTRVWSVAWSAACEHQLVAGLDRGRLALVDLRMTGRECKGLLSVAAAPGVQQQLLRVAALGAGAGGGAAWVAAAPSELLARGVPGIAGLQCGLWFGSRGLVEFW